MILNEIKKIFIANRIEKELAENDLMHVIVSRKKNQKN